MTIPLYVWFLAPILFCLLSCVHYLSQIARSADKMETSLNDIRYQIEKSVRDNEWVGTDEYRHGNEG